MKNTRRLLCLLLAALILISLLAISSCSKDEKKTVTEEKTTQTTDEKTTTTNNEDKTDEITISIKIVHADNSEKAIEVKTSATNLMDALKGENLIEEADGMITAVDGEKADYSSNQSWWCITKNGAMTTTGAQETPIADSEQYELTYTIG